MTDHWEHYFARVDDKIASFLVNISIRDQAPDGGLPFVAYVRLHMNSPRDDGLSSNDEADLLAAVEDALENALVDARAVYVGICTTNACRDLFFYVAGVENWDEKVAAAMQPFPSYRFESGSWKDEEWSSYLTYLYPSPRNWAAIGDRRVCKALEEAGDKLVEPRGIDHWIYFDSREPRDSFVAAAASLGFHVRELTDPDSQSKKWKAQLWRMDVPAYDKIDDILTPLRDLAEEHGGDYDGWESFVVRDPKTTDGPAEDPR